jgi:hypothetical protein
MAENIPCTPARRLKGHKAEAEAARPERQNEVPFSVDIMNRKFVDGGNNLMRPGAS